MTTMAAMLGGVPLAFGTGVGAELRRPLGITIIGGLMVSQVLTLIHDARAFIWPSAACCVSALRVGVMSSIGNRSI